MASQMKNATEERGNPEYTEADISSMEVTNIRGQRKKLDKNEALVLDESDVLELDIVVGPPLHK